MSSKTFDHPVIMKDSRYPFSKNPFTNGLIVSYFAGVLTVWLLGIIFGIIGIYDEPVSEYPTEILLTGIVTFVYSSVWPIGSFVLYDIKDGGLDFSGNETTIVILLPYISAVIAFLVNFRASRSIDK
ncbi:MAG: hypothetical protein ACW99F_01125 [Candidatus Hodarchaeales archaeon]